MKKSTMLAGLLAGALSLVAAATPAWADALDRIKEAGVLRVAVPQDSPPFGMADANLELVGYDVEVAKLIAEKLGVSLEMTPVISANRVPYMTTGRVDLIISSLGYNEERAEIIDFSQPYAPFFSGVFGLPDSGISGYEDLSGKTVSVARGNIEDLTLTELAPADARIVRYEDGNTSMAAFLSGQADVIATANTTAATVLATNPTRRPELLFPIKDSPCYVGIPKGEDALREAVDAIIAEAKADGTLNDISKRWFLADLPEGF